MRYLVSLLLFVVSSLAFADRSNRTFAHQALKGLEKSIKELCAIDLRCKGESDCLAIALGHKACGGPQSYTFTAKESFILEEIKYLAASLEKKERRYNMQYTVISDCEYIMPPKLSCINQRCELARR